MQTQLDGAVFLLETVGHAGGRHRGEPYYQRGPKGIEAYCAYGSLAKAARHQDVTTHVVQLLYAMGLTQELASWNDYDSEPGEVPTLFALAAEVVREGALA
jgi:hypothetical protein